MSDKTRDELVAALCEVDRAWVEVRNAWVEACEALLDYDAAKAKEASDEQD